MLLKLVNGSFAKKKYASFSISIYILPTHIKRLALHAVNIVRYQIGVIFAASNIVSRITVFGKNYVFTSGKIYVIPSSDIVAICICCVYWQQS